MIRNRPTRCIKHKPERQNPRMKPEDAVRHMADCGGSSSVLEDRTPHGSYVGQTSESERLHTVRLETTRLAIPDY